MIYVALLRGINVGGKRKVSMKLLKDTFERAGMESVITYINSGNVIFKSNSRDSKKLTRTLETAIETDFGFVVKVLLRDHNTIKAIVKALPEAWKNDLAMKCDVMFLWEQLDHPDVIKHLTIKSAIDEVRYMPGAVLWRVDRVNVTKSAIMKLVGTELYKHMTIRNCNTTRKLLELMENTGG